MYPYKITMGANKSKVAVVKEKDVTEYEMMEYIVFSSPGGFKQVFETEWERVDYVNTILTGKYEEDNSQFELCWKDLTKKRIIITANNYKRYTKKVPKRGYVPPNQYVPVPGEI